MQEVIPADNSLVSLMLRTRNKETGAGLTDLQVVAQTNTFIAAGMWQLHDSELLINMAIKPAGEVLQSSVRSRLRMCDCRRCDRAGYETTASTLSFAVYLLAQNPEAERKLSAEVDALGSR